MHDAEGESELRAKGWNTEGQANRGWSRIPVQGPEMEEDQGPEQMQSHLRKSSSV